MRRSLIPPRYVALTMVQLANNQVTKKMGERKKIAPTDFFFESLAPTE